MPTNVLLFLATSKNQLVRLLRACVGACVERWERPDFAPTQGCCGNKDKQQQYNKEIINYTIVSVSLLEYDIIILYNEQKKKKYYLQQIINIRRCNTT